MDATAIIPVKRFGAAKQRLLEALDRRQRAAIVKAMLADVLTSIAATERVERVIVVTGEGRAERLALHHARRKSLPLEVFRDPDDAGHSEAATLGIVRARELDLALERMRQGRVAVVPDRHGTGTNALLLSPADAIGPAFGEGSCERHADRGRRAGLAVAVEPLPSLALDLDTPADLLALAEALEGNAPSAPATAAELARLGTAAGGR
jgi:2-phospho-L-lactate/phosphoenolpyruvate guanylyltransferase